MKTAGVRVTKGISLVSVAGKLFARVAMSTQYIFTDSAYTECQSK